MSTIQKNKWLSTMTTPYDEDEFSDNPLGLENGYKDNLPSLSSTDEDSPTDTAAPIQTPLPMDQMACAFFLQMTEALNITVLFPYMAFFVEDLGKDGPNLAIYVGMLAACFCGAQFISTPIWAMLSDRYGRKPTLFLGTLGTGLGMLIFGFATTYEQAIAGRVISGLLCGNLAVLKAFLTEITDTTNRGPGFSVLAISWSIGTVFSPLIGGMLVKPSEKYPHIFKGTVGDFFSADGGYPYLLPSLVCATFNVFTALAIFILLRETNKNPVPCCWPYRSVDSDTHGGGYEGEYNDVEYEMLEMSSSHHGNKHKDGDGDSDGDGDGDERKRDDGILNPLQSGLGPGSGSGLENSKHSLLADGGGSSSSHDDNQHEYANGGGGGEGGAEGEGKATPLVYRRIVQLAVLSYGMLAFAQVIMDETLPLLFKESIANGGFSMDTNDIGFLLSLAGITFAVFTSMVLPAISRYKKSTLYWIGCIFSIPAALAFPMLPILSTAIQRQVDGNGSNDGNGSSNDGDGSDGSGGSDESSYMGYTAVPGYAQAGHWSAYLANMMFLPSNEGSVVPGSINDTADPGTTITDTNMTWGLILFFLLWKNVTFSLAFVAVAVQVNQSVDRDIELSSVNAIGQSMASIARSVGPACGGTIYAMFLSVKDIGVKGNFIILSGILFLCTVVNRQLPLDLDDKEVNK